MHRMGLLSVEGGLPRVGVEPIFPQSGYRLCFATHSDRPGL